MSPTTSKMQQKYMSLYTFRGISPTLANLMHFFDFILKCEYKILV